MIEISELAKRSGNPASTLRYYEERGLIRSVGRYGLRRVFAEDVFDRLALIALGRAAGFSLDEIAEMFTDNEGMEIERRKLIEKADELDNTISKLTVIRDALRHTADCPAPRHMECPNFLRILKSAGQGLLPPLGEFDRPVKRRRRKRSRTQ